VRSGPELLLMSWGDGSGVPASGNDLIIVGADDNGLLHFRIFDAGGKLVTDTDETRLLCSEARAISDIKQHLPGLAPPHMLTAAEKDRVIAELTSIFGRTLRKLSGTVRYLRPGDLLSLPGVEDVHFYVLGPPVPQAVTGGMRALPRATTADNPAEAFFA